jgi:hypothetical protein
VYSRPCIIYARNSATVTPFTGTECLRFVAFAKVNPTRASSVIPGNKDRTQSSNSANTRLPGIAAFVRKRFASLAVHWQAFLRQICIFIRWNSPKVQSFGWWEVSAIEKGLFNLFQRGNNRNATNPAECSEQSTPKQNLQMSLKQILALFPLYFGFVADVDAL